MSGSPKEKLQTVTEEVATEESREVYLRDGRKLVVTDAGTDQLVEVRSQSGLVELRIRLTEQGPVLQMESVRLQLKADEKIEIESKRVEIKATEQLALDGGKVTVDAKEEGVEIDAEGAVRVVGKTIHLN
jgi:uncharacterized protein (DUF2345 family)